MIRLNFRNFQESFSIREIATHRIESVVSRFPELIDHNVFATIELENGEQNHKKRHKNIFKVKLFIEGRKYRKIVLEKKSSNIFAALADVMDHTLERLNRFGDRVRVKSRKKALFLVPSEL